MIVYKFKVTFEEVDDVERVIEITASQTFNDLYACIIDQIKFKADTLASFYVSGDAWRKGKEISNNPDRGAVLMSDAKLNTYVNDPHQRFLLITEDDLEWTLRIALFKIERGNPENSYPVCTKAVGEAPKQTKADKLGLATNEFEAMVDEIITDEDEELDISEMGFDDEMEG